MIGRQHMTAKGFTGNKKKHAVHEDSTIDRHCKYMGTVNAVQNASMDVILTHKNFGKSFSYEEAVTFISALRKEGYEIKEIK